MPNTWNRLGITQEVVDRCDRLSQNSANEKSRKYWGAARNFLKHIEKTSYSDLVTSQRNWAGNILRDLRERALS